MSLESFFRRLTPWRRKATAVSHSEHGTSVATAQGLKAPETGTTELPSPVLRHSAGDLAADAGSTAPSVSQDEISTRYWLVCLVIAVVFLLTSLLLELAVEKEEWVAKLGPLPRLFFRDMGMAILVAVIVAYTLEQQMNKKTQERHEKNLVEIKNKTLEALFGIYLEPQLFSQFLFAVLTRRVKHKNCVIAYHFERSETEDAAAPQELRRVKLTVAIRYELHNIAHRDVTERFWHFFEVSLPKTTFPPAYTRFRLSGYKKVHGCDGPIDWDNAAIEQKLKSGRKRDREDREEYRRELPSFEVEISPDKPVTVEIEYVTEKQYCDSDIWLSSVPGDGLKVMVFVSEKLLPMRFWANTAHWQQAGHPNSRRTNQQNYFEWEMNSVFLQGQGFILNWFPKG